MGAEQNEELGYRFWPTPGEGRMTAARVVAASTIDRQIAALQARKAEVLASEWQSIERQTARIPSAVSRERELPLRTAAAEFAAAAKVSDAAMQNLLEKSHTLVHEFAATHARLREGRVSQAQAWAIVDTGRSIVDAQARALFEASALELAGRMTPGQLRHAAALLADRLQPRSLLDRHRTARDDRRVRVVDVADGMAELYALLPAALAHGIHDRLTQQAKAVTQARDAQAGAARVAAAARTGAGQAGDAQAGAAEAGAAQAGAQAVSGPEIENDPFEPDMRTTDQLRADLLADMLLTASPAADPTAEGDGPGLLGSIRAMLQVTVSALTLAGEDDAPAELAGRAPIDPDTARTLAARCPTWTRILTHPITGMVVAVDRHDPTPQMRRFLAARDGCCRFPGCTMSARRCDVDHTADWALGGRTEIGNLAHLCKRHHMLKHHTPWAVKQLPGGVLEWTSPTGRVYTDEPPPRVAFTPESEPAPF